MPRWSPATLAEVSQATIAAILQGSGDPEPSYEPGANAKWGSLAFARNAGSAVA